MPPSLALLIGLVFIVSFFRLDKDPSGDTSRALWIPFAWMCIGASRYIGHWLNPGTAADLSVYAEGSPLDRAVFLFLIVAGTYVLLKRRLSWRNLFANNIWVWLYFLYGLISLAWSDLPFVALKRWIKGLGTLIMALIILSEVKPYKALERVLRKMAFLLLPLSVVLINYFPRLGRTFHMGRPTYIGVTGHKNMLGMLCLIAGIYFLWTFLYQPLERTTSKDRVRLAFYAVVVAMILWLFNKADSATSRACMFAAIFILLVSRIPSFRRKPQRTIAFFVVFFIMAFSIEALFGVKDRIIALLGREPSLTSRVPMWKDLMSMVRNPMLGFGYDSFWMGERQQYIYETWGIRQSAHNGYLEMYLNLGLLGVLFIVAWIVSGLRKVRRYLQADYSRGILRLTIIVVAAIYSYAEATFYGVSFMWALLFLAIMDPLIIKGAPGPIGQAGGPGAVESDRNVRS
jgi:exopolysaccharide production protein ExoQ